ncbi:hypothetical protein [Coleofasciculus sp. F4-SAH-05]|uniref:hypothetical protein n=1 Tax=Coleofasciculus sp. F4-SAH-05 TaxID=3069525 RepID=UPI0032F55169
MFSAAETGNIAQQFRAITIKIMGNLLSHLSFVICPLSFVICHSSFYASPTT